MVCIVIRIELIAIGIGRWHRDHVVRDLVLWNILGRYFVDGLRITVIGRIGDHDARVPGYRACDAKRQFVGLAAGATEHDVVELGGKFPGQPFGKFEHVPVQVTRMRIQCSKLLGDRRNHLRMTMPDVWHVVIQVQVLLAVRIIKPDARAAHDVHGVIVEQAVGRAKQVAAPLDHC